MVWWGGGEGVGGSGGVRTRALKRYDALCNGREENGRQVRNVFTSCVMEYGVINQTLEFVRISFASPSIIIAQTLYLVLRKNT